MDNKHRYKVLCIFITNYKNLFNALGMHYNNAFQMGGKWGG